MVVKLYLLVGWFCCFSLSLGVSRAGDEAVNALVETHPAKRVQAVFHFARDASLEQVTVAVPLLLEAWPERWEYDERVYLLPLLVRWAELDSPSLTTFARENKYYYRFEQMAEEAIAFTKPPVGFLEQLSRFEPGDEIGDILSQWAEQDIGAAQQWYQNHELRYPREASIISQAMGTQIGFEEAKQWADQRAGLVSRQMAIVGWLRARAETEPEKVWQECSSMPDGRARQLGSQAALVEMSALDTRTALARAKGLGDESTKTISQIFHKSALDRVQNPEPDYDRPPRFEESALDACFSFVSSHSNHVYIDEFLKVLAEFPLADITIAYLKEWHSGSSYEPIEELFPIVQQLITSDLDTAVDIALKSLDKEATIQILQAFAFERPAEAIALAHKTYNKTALLGISNGLFRNDSPELEEFLFVDYEHVEDLDSQRARYLWAEMARDSNKAGDLFDRYMPPWPEGKQLDDEFRGLWFHFSYNFNRKSIAFEERKRVALSIPDSRYRLKALNGLDFNCTDLRTQPYDPHIASVFQQQVLNEGLGRLAWQFTTLYDSPYLESILRGIEQGIESERFHCGELLHFLGDIESDELRELAFEKILIENADKFERSEFMVKVINESELSAEQKQRMIDLLAEPSDDSVSSDTPILDPFAPMDNLTGSEPVDPFQSDSEDPFE